MLLTGALWCSVTQPLFYCSPFFHTYQDKTGGSQDVTYLSYAIQIHKNGCQYCGDQIFLDPLKFHVVQLSIGVHLNWRLVFF